MGTALNALGLVLGCISLGVSGVVWFFSRAGKVRAFEGRVYAQLTNAASRIERIEGEWLQEKATLNGICDEMVTTTEKTAKERRRLYAEHKREDDAKILAGNNQPAELGALPREEQLRHVRAFFNPGH